VTAQAPTSQAGPGSRSDTARALQRAGLPLALCLMMALAACSWDAAVPDESRAAARQAEEASHLAAEAASGQGAAASAANGQGAAAPPASDEPSAATPGQPQATASTALAWHPCTAHPGEPAAGQECATLQVPLDYRQPTGRRIDLAVTRLRSAQPALRHGVLLLNAGGPGSEVRGVVALFALLLPRSVLDRYDLLGLDPRGTGASTPLSCGLAPPQAATVLPLEQPGGFEATTAFVRDIADRCATQAGDLLPHISTANMARDMDRLRHALGEPKLSYLGYAQGTYLGAVYASLFPRRLDRMVLDSAVAPGGQWRETWRALGPAGEVRFADFALYAAARHARHHLGRTPDEVRAQFFQLADRLARQPLALPDGSRLDGARFRHASHAGLHADSRFATLAQLWQAVAEAVPAGEAPPRALARPHARERVARLLAELLGGGDAAAAASAVAATLALACADAPWSRSLPQYRREFDLDRKLYPMFGALGSNVHACAFWPGAPQEPTVGIAATGPSRILVTSHLRDPVAPVWGALAMRFALGAPARLLSVAGGGHGVYLLSASGCANDAATALLAEGTLPAADRLCDGDPGPVMLRAGLAPQAEAVREQARRELQRRLGPR
jgi:pimeloyl-ACP methyl ester carboxylesterase